MYEALKDFLPSIVTLITAAVAAGITISFARVQAKIARSQRDIALDKLKFDLFEKRYAIYSAAKQLLEQLALVSDIKKADSSTIRGLYVTLDEARFYFPLETRHFLSQITAASERFLEHVVQREVMSIDDTDQWRVTADTLARDQAELRRFYASLPEKFETALAFRQLTVS